MGSMMHTRVEAMSLAEELVQEVETRMEVLYDGGVIP